MLTSEQQNQCFCVRADGRHVMHNGQESVLNPEELLYTWESTSNQPQASSKEGDSACCALHGWVLQSLFSSGHNIQSKNADAFLPSCIPAAAQ